MDLAARRAAVVAVVQTAVGATVPVHDDVPDTIPTDAAVVVRWSGTAAGPVQWVHTFRVEIIVTTGPDRITRRDTLTTAVLAALNSTQGLGRPSAETAEFLIGLQAYPEQSLVTVTATDDPPNT
jgi:hypothetical protein